VNKKQSLVVNEIDTKDAVTSSQSMLPASVPKELTIRSHSLMHIALIALRGKLFHYGTVCEEFMSTRTAWQELYQQLVECGPAATIPCTRPCM
jgi:hypothetical protein